MTQMNTRPPEGPIQLTPPGLLGLLQLKTGGFLPDTLKQDVQPTINMEPWYLRATASVLYALPIRNLAPGVYNDFVGWAAPADIRASNTDTWYVHNFTIQCFGNASSITYARPAVQYSGGVPSFFGLGDVSPALAAGGTSLIVARDFWIPPGAELGMYVGTVGAGGTGDFLCVGLEYTRCQL